MRALGQKMEVRERAGQSARRARDARCRESDAHGHRCEDDGGGDFHESEIEELFFEQNDEGDVSFEWTFESAGSGTVRP